MKPVVVDPDQVYWNIFQTTCDGVLITDLQTGLVLVSNPAAADIHGYSPETFSELHLQELIHLDSLSLFAELSKKLNHGGLFEARAQHVKQDGSLISVDWRAVAFTYRGRNCSLAVLREVSKRALAEQDLQQRLAARAREQSTLFEISQTLALTLELQPDLILDQLKILINYSHATFFVLEESSLISLAVHGTERLKRLEPFRIRLNGDKSRTELFKGNRPILISDVWSDEPSAKTLQKLLKNGSAVLLEDVHSWMWVPLMVKNRNLGGIGIAHGKPDFFTSHNADLAMTIANQAAVTLLNAELLERAQSLAAMQERQRLAQNLHDAVNQSLFSAGLIAEVLPRLWERSPDDARRSLEDLRRLTRGAQAEMRALLAELRPSTLIDSELGDLIRLLGNAYTGRTNIPVIVTVKGEGNLPPDTQVALYRICQEALNNIAKHANASQVEIELNHTPGVLDLNIHDNGLGFDTFELAPSGHYGLSMMRERAGEVGLKLEISSQSGVGTDVIIHWRREGK